MVENRAPLSIRLFVDQESDLGRRSASNLRAFIETQDLGEREFFLHDVFEEVELLARYRVVATPCLIIERGDRTRKLVGDLADRQLLTRFFGGM